MEEVFIELGFLDDAVVISLAELEYGYSVFAGIRFEDLGKMSRLSLWRNTKTIGAVPGKTGLRVDTWLCDPDGVILLDSGLDSALEPLAVSIHVRAIELIVDLKSHVGKERRLGTTKIITAASVQNFAVMLNLKDEMVDHALGHGHLPID